MFRTCADLLETSKNRQTQCCFSQIHRFLIYHSYSTAIYFCNFLKASINYQEYILLVTKDFKLGGDNVKFCFNILLIFLKYNTWKKKLAGFWTSTNFFNIYFNVWMLSIKYLVPAWKIILSILKFPLKLACISLRITWLVAPE